jgi:hypothetical protein
MVTNRFRTHTTGLYKVSQQIPQSNTLLSTARNVSLHRRYPIPLTRIVLTQRSDCRVVSQVCSTRPAHGGHVNICTSHQLNALIINPIAHHHVHHDPTTQTLPDESPATDAGRSTALPLPRLIPSRSSGSRNNLAQPKQLKLKAKEHKPAHSSLRKFRKQLRVTKTLL